MFEIFGGDGAGLFETRPLEDILADIVDGWNSTRRYMHTREPVGAYNSGYEL
jgi:hypothetical protein